MTAVVCSAKLDASAGVLPVNIRVQGLSSRPPLARLVRVTKKSPVAAMPVAAKSTRFWRSQNRCVVASFSATRESMIGIGAAKGSAAAVGSCTGVRDGNGELEAISTVCGGTTAPGSGPCALVFAVATRTATNVSGRYLSLKAEKLFINDFCSMCIPSLRTCTFAASLKEENGPEVSWSRITKATGRGGVACE